MNFCIVVQIKPFYYAFCKYVPTRMALTRCIYLYSKGAEDFEERVAHLWFIK